MRGTELRELMKKLEEYQSLLGERAAKIVLENLYNLRLDKIPKKKGQKTPDYELIDSQKNIAIAVCEVKSTVDVINPTDAGKTLNHESLSTISKARDRNHRGKLMQHHGKAISQFVEYPNAPTVVIFVSFDMTDPVDMARVLQEYKDLYSGSKMADTYILMKVDQPIIPANSFDLKEMQLRHISETGKEFGQKYLSSSEGRLLPITFRLS